MKAHITRIAILASTYAALTGLLVVGFVLAQDPPEAAPEPSGRQMKMDQLEKALKAVEDASKAVESDEKETALAELKKAKELITTAHTCMVGPKVVNARCPMMGNKINPATVPDNLTRMYNDQKVGFCCAECPMAWDKLSDEDKGAKLAGAGKALKCGCVDACKCWK